MFALAVVGLGLSFRLPSRSPPPRAAVAEEVAPGELRSPSELRKGIAKFYDKSSGVWEKVWGEHMHHGYYPGGARKDHVQAQVDMIDAVLEWSGVGRDGGAAPARVLDVGCGIGGSTRHIARKYGAEGVGITLSPVQAARAGALADAQGLGDKVQFQVADALNMPFADDSFDLVWSLESGEHMPDKEKFVAELSRVRRAIRRNSAQLGAILRNSLTRHHNLSQVLKPGGRLIVVTWCHRDLAAGESALLPKEERLLRLINRAYYLPRWCSVARYVDLIGAKGLTGIKRDDWTDDIALFWPAVIRSAFRPRALLGLLRSGLSTIRGALVMPLMIRGYKKGLIVFGLVTAKKPYGSETVQ